MADEKGQAEERAEERAEEQAEEGAGPTAEDLRRVWLPIGDAQELTLSNGIRLRVKPFPRALLRAALSQYPDPEVPVVEFEDGSREENPNDPDYQAAWERVHEERLEAAARVTLGYGIEADLESLPEGYVGPDDDTWIHDMKALGVDPGDISTPFLRRYAWLNLYAIPTDEERALVALVAQQAVGLVEREVVRAMRFFQDLGARRAHSRREAAAPAAGDTGSGDRVRAGGALAGVRIRGTGRREVEPDPLA